MIWTKFIWSVEDYSRNISVKLLSKYLQWDSNKSQYFSHSKSMETLSCHSNQSVWATAVKNNTFVQASVRNTYAKFQLYPPKQLLRSWFLNIFSKIYPLCCHDNQSNSAIWTKFIWIIEDYSRNISVKKISISAVRQQKLPISNGN